MPKQQIISDNKIDNAVLDFVDAYEANATMDDLQIILLCSLDMGVPIKDITNSKQQNLAHLILRRKFDDQKLINFLKINCEIDFKQEDCYGNNIEDVIKFEEFCSMFNSYLSGEIDIDDLAISAPEYLINRLSVDGKSLFSIVIESIETIPKLKTKKLEAFFNLLISKGFDYTIFTNTTNDIFTTASNSELRLIEPNSPDQKWQVQIDTTIKKESTATQQPQLEPWLETLFSQLINVSPELPENDVEIEFSIIISQYEQFDMGKHGESLFSMLQTIQYDQRLANFVIANSATSQFPNQPDAAKTPAVTDKPTTSPTFSVSPNISNELSNATIDLTLEEDHNDTASKSAHPLTVEELFGKDPKHLPRTPAIKRPSPEFREQDDEDEALEFKRPKARKLKDSGNKKDSENILQ